MGAAGGAEGAEPLGRKLATQRAQRGVPAGAGPQGEGVPGVPGGPEVRATAPVRLRGHVQAQRLVGGATVGGAKVGRLRRLPMVSGRAGWASQGGVETRRAWWGRQSGAGSGRP